MGSDVGKSCGMNAEAVQLLGNREFNFECMQRCKPILKIYSIHSLFDVVGFQPTAKYGSYFLQFV